MTKAQKQQNRDNVVQCELARAICLEEAVCTREELQTALKRKMNKKNRSSVIFLVEKLRRLAGDVWVPIDGGRDAD